MKRLVAGLVLMLASASGVDAREPLYVDLARNEILIHASFTGAELLLFGTIDGPGDVAITVSGPLENSGVRRKVRVGGIWLNGERVIFRSVPSYYAFATTRPLKAIAPAWLRRELGIGLDTRIADAGQAGHRAGLVREYVRRGLYAVEPSRVQIQDEALFRASFRLPAETPTGEYVVEAFLFRDGEVQAHQVRSVRVERAGFDALVHDLAHQNPISYGLLAIFVALATGFSAAEIFRRV